MRRRTVSLSKVTGKLGVVPVGKSRSDILVMQPTQDRHGERLTDGLHSARKEIGGERLPIAGRLRSPIQTAELPRNHGLDCS